MTIISTHFKENVEGNFQARAEIVRVNEKTYKIDYYDINGNFITEEHFPDKSIHYVESAANNWASDIKVLNG
jgi:hypothetical protein